MVTSVKVTLKHEDGRLVTKVLPWGKDALEADPGSVGIALDYLGFANPEPWTVLFIEEVLS